MLHINITSKFNTKKIVKSAMQTYFLSYDESIAIAKSHPNLYKSNELETWTQGGKCGGLLKKELSIELLELLAKLQSAEIPALVIRGFGIKQNLPPTPLNGRADLNKISRPLELMLGIFNIIEASPVGYSGENEDCFIRHVVPAIAATNEVSSHGSIRPLNSHIDNPHLPIGNESCEHESSAPNFIGWLGLRCELDVPTSIIFLEDIVKTLPQEVVNSLKKPIFKIRRPPSFGEAGITQKIAPLLVPDTDGNLCIRHGFSNSTDLESENAMNLLSLTADDKSISHQVILRTGDLLIINNQKCLHGRDVFKPRCDGTDRWLLRFYGVNNWRPNWMDIKQLPYLIKG